MIFFVAIDDNELEESESNDRFVRNKVDQFLNNSKYGKAIDIIVALLSLFTSMAFIVLTYYDMRNMNQCCDTAMKQHALHKEEMVFKAEDAMSEYDWLAEHG